MPRSKGMSARTAVPLTRPESVRLCLLERSGNAPDVAPDLEDSTRQIGKYCIADGYDEQKSAIIGGDHVTGQRLKGHYQPACVGFDVGRRSRLTDDLPLRGTVGPDAGQRTALTEYRLTGPERVGPGLLVHPVEPVDDCRGCRL